MDDKQKAAVCRWIAEKVWPSKKCERIGGCLLLLPYSESCECRNWEKLDFFTSEDASARLLEAMRYSLLVSDWPGCEGWRIDMGVNPDRTLIGQTHLDRKTAIVLAACKWLGIKIPGVSIRRKS